MKDDVASSILRTLYRLENDIERLKRVPSNNNGNSGFNYIINGDMEISQRGTSFVSPATAAYTLDRFRVSYSGAMAFTITQDSSVVPTYSESGYNSKYSLKVDCTTIDASIAAGDYAMLTYGIEGYDIISLLQRNITLSFWVYSNKVGVYCVAFRNSGGDRSYLAEYTINSANTWEKKTITIPLNETGGTWDYITGVGLKIVFCLACGSTYQGTVNVWNTGNYLATSNQVNFFDSTSNNFYITQVKLEKGSIPSVFCKRGVGFAEEMALCQRYYYLHVTGNNQPIGLGVNYNTTTMYCYIKFPVEMRVTPSPLQGSGTNYFIYYVNRGSITFTSFNGNDAINKNGVEMFKNSLTLTAGQGGMVRTNNVSAYLAFQCEL